MSDYSDSDTQSLQLSDEEITTKVPQNFSKEYKHYYKKIINPDITRVKSHMFIKKHTDVKKCIAYCIDLMYNKQYPYVKLSAISQNMDKAVFMAELLKRKIKNLYQVNELSTFTYHELYTPKKPSEERYKFKIEKLSTCLSIQLSRNVPKETKSYGYQDPIQISLVSTRDPREYIDYVLKLENQPKKKKQLNQMRDHYKNNKYHNKDSYSKQQHQKQVDYQKRHQRNKQGDHYQQRNNDQQRGKYQDKYQKKQYNNSKHNKHHYNKNQQNKNEHDQNSQQHTSQNKNQNQTSKNYKQKQHYKQNNDIYQKKNSNQSKEQKKQKKNEKQKKKNPEDYAEYYYKQSGKKQKKRQEFEYVKKEDKTPETEIYVKKTD